MRWFWFFLPLLLLLSLPLEAATAPSGLMCDLMAHPEETVITTPHPDFGWIYHPSIRDGVQTGYRIIVASSRALADHGKGDVWDSGLVATNASINVLYAGPELQTSTSYFWRVQTRDSTGRLSPFSAVQQFNTDTHLASPAQLPLSTDGLEWIWYPEGAAPHHSARFFRKTFVIPANRRLAAAQFLLTADDAFTLYVNGTRVGGGDNWKQFSLFTLDSLLHPGSNTLAIAVTNRSYDAGLTGKLDYRDADGHTNTVFINGTWLASQSAPAGWTQPGFDNSAWPHAAVLGKYGISPWNTTAALPLTGLIYHSSTNRWANRYPLRYVTVTPVLVTNTAPGRWFVDFGQDGFGYAKVHLNGAFGGKHVEARFGEMAEGDAVNTHPPRRSTVRYASTNFTLRDGDHVYPVRPPSFRGQDINPPASYGVVMPFRYFELLNCPGPLNATDVVQERLQYQFNTNAASFDSSSPALNRVWTLCRNSMEVLGFDGIYVDGDRERKPYEADSYIHQLSSYAVSREYTMARYSFEYLLRHPTWPTEWKFHMIFIARADYMHTGNSDLLDRYFDALKPDLFLYRATPDGLIRSFPGFPQTTNSDIVDWPPADRDGFIITRGSYKNWTNSVVNAFYYRCLRLMAKAATVIGRPHEAATLSADANRVYRSYNKTFWDKATQAYVDGVGTTHSSAHANFFPLAFGLVPPARVPAVLKFIHSRIAAHRGMPPSVYGAQYLLDGLFENGDANTALGLLTTNGPRGWLNMLQMGSTITTEAWNFHDKPNMDWNHAWGAAAGNLIQRFVLGLRPLSPGGGHVVIQPELGRMLSYVRGTVPTIRGPISIAATNAPGMFRLRVKLPGNVTATVKLPTHGAAHPVATVDGTEVSGIVSGRWLALPTIGSGEHTISLATSGDSGR